MYCECPEFRRCCLCLPLRRGILVFAYFNVVLTILQIAVLYMINVDDLNLTPLRSVKFELPIIFATALCVLDILFNIVLIYGLHTKRVLLIKIFYYFMMCMLLTSVVLECLEVTKSINGKLLFYFIFCLFVNLYLICMVRSLINKLKNDKSRTQMAVFVNGQFENDDVYTEIAVPDEYVTNNVKYSDIV